MQNLLLGLTCCSMAMLAVCPTQSRAQPTPAATPAAVAPAGLPGGPISLPPLVPVVCPMAVDSVQPPRLYPTQECRAGGATGKPAGFLVSRQRWEEVDVLLVETLPSLELQRDRLQESLVAEQRLRQQLQMQAGTPWWMWGAGGLGAGTVLGVLAVVVLQGALQ